MSKLAGISDLIVDSTATVTFKAKEAPTKDAVNEALKALKWGPAVDAFASHERVKPKGSFDIEIDGVG